MKNIYDEEKLKEANEVINNLAESIKKLLMKHLEKL